MPTIPPEFSFSLEDFGKVPPDKVGEVAADVADFVKEEILIAVGSGKSPVAGHGAFDQLSEEYANEFKGGNRKPNLELTARMLDDLEVSFVGDRIEVFIEGSDFSIDKASGHNQHLGGASHLPVRRFIPDKNEEFTVRIRDGIRRIVRRAEKPIDEQSAETILARAFGGDAPRIQANITRSIRQINLDADQAKVTEDLARQVLAGFGGG